MLPTRNQKPLALHCKKRLAVFPSPAGMSLTKRSLAGDKKSAILFYSVTAPLCFQAAGTGAVQQNLPCWRSRSGADLPRLWGPPPINHLEKMVQEVRKLHVHLLPTRSFPAIASLMSGHIEWEVPFPLTNYIHRRQCTWTIDLLPSDTFCSNFCVLRHPPPTPTPLWLQMNTLSSGWQINAGKFSCNSVLGKADKLFGVCIVN
jgi:hypothetical protein